MSIGCIFLRAAQSSQAQCTLGRGNVRRKQTAQKQNDALGRVPKGEICIFWLFTVARKQNFVLFRLFTVAQKLILNYPDFLSPPESKNLQKLHSAKVPKHKNSKISIRLKCRKQKMHKAAFGQSSTA